MRKTRQLTFILLTLATGLFAQEGSTVTKVVNTLKERITLAGYAQLGYTYNDAAKKTNTFDIKRIIFMAHGKITDRWSCDFMYDFYNDGMLLEVYTDYRILPELNVRIGEFKTPYTIENELSPTTVELINCYSQSVCYLAGVSGSDALCGVTSGRDIGMMVYGDLFHKLLTYKLAVMNGQGLNIKDQNNQKDVIGNLMVNPTKWLSIGGSFVKGTGHAIADSEITGIKAGENYRKNRWSIGGVVTTTPFSLRSEYLSGKDGNVRSKGFYATGCVRLLPKFDLIASYDYFNPNDEMKLKQSNYIAGLQYWFYPKCRLQAQYTYCDKQQGGNSNLIQTQIQVRF
ncbi:porin [Bacteroides sp.]